MTRPDLVREARERANTLRMRLKSSSSFVVDADGGLYSGQLDGGAAWDVLQAVNDLDRLASALEAAHGAVEAEREACAKIADLESEAPGQPPAEALYLMRNDPVGAVRAAIRSTKNNIASAIRSRSLNAGKQK